MLVSMLLELVPVVPPLPFVPEFVVAILLGKKLCEWVKWYPVACAVVLPSVLPLFKAVSCVLCATKVGLFELDRLLSKGSSNLFLTVAAADCFPLAHGKFWLFCTLDAVNVKTLFERLGWSLVATVFVIPTTTP